MPVLAWGRHRREKMNPRGHEVRSMGFYSPCKNFALILSDMGLTWL